MAMRIIKPVAEASEPERLEARAEQWRAELQIATPVRKVQLLDWINRAYQSAAHLRAMRAARQRLLWGTK